MDILKRGQRVTVQSWPNRTGRHEHEGKLGVFIGKDPGQLGQVWVRFDADQATVTLELCVVRSLRAGDYPGQWPERVPPVCTDKWSEEDFARWEETQRQRMQRMKEWWEANGMNASVKVQGESVPSEGR